MMTTTVVVGNLQIKRQNSVDFLYNVCYNENSNKIKKEGTNEKNSIGFTLLCDV